MGRAACSPDGADPESVAVEVLHLDLSADNELGAEYKQQLVQECKQ